MYKTCVIHQDPEIINLQSWLEIDTKDHCLSSCIFFIWPLFNFRTAASDKVYQVLAYGRWFSPDNPASSITKTGRHLYSWNIAESGVKHQKSINQSNFRLMITHSFGIFKRLLSILALLLSNTFKLFGSPIFRYWMYLMKVIPESRRAH